MNKMETKSGKKMNLKFELMKKNCSHIFMLIIIYSVFFSRSLFSMKRLDLVEWAGEWHKKENGETEIHNHA